jgi:hypothetical protein
MDLLEVERAKHLNIAAEYARMRKEQKQAGFHRCDSQRPQTLTGTVTNRGPAGNARGQRNE